jgi:hypothetical protein
MNRKLFSRHTPKGLEKYKEPSEKDIEKMSNKEKFDFLDKEYDKAGRNEYRYAKKKAKKHGIVGGIIGAGMSSYSSRNTSKGNRLASAAIGAVGGGLVGGIYGYNRGEGKAREEGHDRIKILEKNAEKLEKANKKKEDKGLYELYAKCKVYDEALGTDTSKQLKKFSNYHLEKRFNDSSEEKKKKDSGFGWGKALGTAAAVAGTMYGAKKGMFGSRIQRGYNTAYGKLGNALGSQSMVNSAARDWAVGSVKNPGKKGSKMQYNRDIINKQNEFKSQFNKNNSTVNPGNNSPAPAAPAAPAVKQDVTTTAKENVSPFLTGTGFNNTTSSKPSFDNLVDKNTVVPKVQPGAESIMKKTNANRPFMGPMSRGGSIDDKVYGLQMGSVSYNPNGKVGSIMQPKPQQGASTQAVTPQLTSQQRRSQRLATTGAENYQLAQEFGYKTEKTVKKPKMSREDYLAMKAKRTEEHNRRTQLNKDRKNKKNAGLMGVTNPDPNTFYATPDMFQQKTMSILENFAMWKYFSEKEKEDSRKKKIRNAALLGVGALGVGAAAAYGIKKGKNSRKNIKELEKTVKQNNQKINELRKERESVLTNLKNSEKELGELRNKAKALANGKYKFSQKEIDEFMKNMEDPNYVIEL